MPKIDYFFTPLSPYTYLAGGALENIAEKLRASIHYRPVDVVSLFGRTGGVALPDRHPSRLDYRAQDLTRRAAMLDMPFHLKPAHVPTNPAPASNAIIAAQNAGNGNLGNWCRVFCAPLGPRKRTLPMMPFYRICWRPVDLIAH